MNNIKCAQCGLVNWTTDVECKRCGSLLTVQEKQARQFGAFAPGPQPFFSNGLKILTAILILAFVVVVLTRGLHIISGDTAAGFSVTFMLLGLVLMLLTHIWLVIRIFEQSVAWGLGTLCIPIVGLIATIKFWENTKRSFVGQLVCVGIMIVGAQIMPAS